MAAILYCQRICRNCRPGFVLLWFRVSNAINSNECFMIHRQLSTNHDEFTDYQKKKLHSPHGEQGCSSPQEQGTQSHNKLGHSAWRPTKRLPWHQIEYLRTLRQEDPEEWTHSKLAKQFGISVSAVTRILKSKFIPTPEVAERQDALAQKQQQRRRETWRTHKSDERE